MHDPTEGGVAGGLLEVRKACGLGIVLDAGSIPISPLTARASEKLGFDPLHLISSGVLLAVLDRREADEALSKLTREGIPASVIGRFVEPAGEYKSDAHEELWALLDRPVR